MTAHTRLFGLSSSALTLAAGLWLLSNTELGYPPATSAFLAFVLSTTSLAGVWLAGDSLQPSLSKLYLTTIYLFHFGLLVPLTRGNVEFDLLSAYWIGQEPVARAVAIALVAFGASCFVAISTSRSDVRAGSNQTDYDHVRVPAQILLLGSMAALFALALGSIGLPAFSGNYLDFVSTVPATPASLSYLGIAFGTVLYFGVTRPKATGWVSVVTVAGFTAMLRIGLRGEVLFPVVAAIGVRSLTGVRIRPSRAAWAALAAMSSIPLLRTVRLGPDAGALSLNPLSGIGELGFTIRAVAVASRLADDQGMRLGETYAGTVLRPLQRIGVGGDVPTPINVELLNEVGPIGFSPVAEAHLNFGIVGVFCWSVGIMILISQIERHARRGSEFALLAGGMTFSVLVYQVRNSFTAVPFQIISAFAIAAFVSLLRAKKRKGRNNNGPATLGRVLSSTTD